MDVEEVRVVRSLPATPGVDASGHVASDSDVVGETVSAVSWKIAVVVEPCGDAGEDEASPVLGGWACAFVVGAADVDGVLKCADALWALVGNGGEEV